MSPKPVRPRARARQDVDEAIEFYLAEAGPDVALRFIAALERTYQAMSRHPATGSPRYGQDLGLPGLRSRPLRGFPYIVFYLERQHDLDVWRVLHARRDIPAWL